MSTIFERLGYAYIDTAGDIKQLPADTISNMSVVPTLLEPWQITDIQNDDVGGYTENPLASTLSTLDSHRTNILNTFYTTSSNNITGSTASITSKFDNIKSTAIALANNIIDFKLHTDRLSDVRSYSDDLAAGFTNMDEFPYYVVATSVGKALSYIIMQTDNVQNTVGIMGSFTSLLTKPTLSNVAITISTHASTISNSLTITCDTSNTSICWANSNLSSTVVESISNDLTSLSTLLVTRKNHDENFFKNSQKLMGEVKKVKAFSQMGASEDYLAKNIIGTDKLKSRIIT